ncbi:peptidase A4 family-domain-containing protein [Amanita rubescens]|nr:peptidase A4 family-domain-containing protein [Amanita rubescens]
MVATSLFTSILLAAAAFAAPSSVVESRTHRRRSGILDRTSTKFGTNGTSNVAYSNNWSGAVWESDPSGPFKSVTGTFKVPTPSGPDGDSSVWVGIDGDTCGSAILQAGIYVNIKGGIPSYNAWYEWYPADAVNFNDITISAGDVIQITITANTNTNGIVKIENHTTGQVVGEDLTSQSPLCLQNAEWIVEDFMNNGVDVPFCDFGTVQFVGASATTTSGKNVSPVGAQVFIIQKNGVDKTSVQVKANNITISYRQ